MSLEEQKPTEQLESYQSVKGDRSDYQYPNAP
jgi:hypothetical protein